MSYGHGSLTDYYVKDMTDQFLIDLHQDWLLSVQLFSNTERSTKMIKAIEEEMKCRKLYQVEYGWTDPRTWESVNSKT